MGRLQIRARVKEGINLEELGRGFCWDYYDPVRGVHWTNKIITIYSNTRELQYEKLTQEVLNCILDLYTAGKVDIIT